LSVLPLLSLRCDIFYFFFPVLFAALPLDHIQNAWRKCGSNAFLGSLYTGRP